MLFDGAGLPAPFSFTIVTRNSLYDTIDCFEVTILKKILLKE